MTKKIYNEEKYGHWYVQEDFIIDDWLGFVYRITNLTNNRQYIGQKKLWSSIKRPPLKGKKRHRRCKKESDWKSYTGSSSHLNEDINLLGKENFKFEIISLHNNKWDMNYYETKHIILEDAIPKEQYYNAFISRIGKCPGGSKIV